MLHHVWPGLAQDLSITFRWFVELCVVIRVVVGSAEGVGEDGGDVSHPVTCLSRFHHISVPFQHILAPSDKSRDFTIHE